MLRSGQPCCCSQSWGKKRLFSQRDTDKQLEQAEALRSEPLTVFLTYVHSRGLFHSDLSRLTEKRREICPKRCDKSLKEDKNTQRRRCLRAAHQCDGFRSLETVMMVLQLHQLAPASPVSAVARRLLSTPAFLYSFIAFISSIFSLSWQLFPGKMSDFT